MKNSYNLMHLFPVPLYVAKINPEITDTEFEFVNDRSIYKFIDGQNYASHSMTILNFPELSRIKDLVYTHLNNYARDIMNIDQKLFPTVSWLNRNPKGTGHPRHKHVNSFVSGVIYFTDPVPIEFHTSRTVIRSDFYLVPTKFNIYNASDWWVPIEKNHIILFPSWVEHSVFANTQEEDRISLSFNSFVNGKLGSLDNSNYLDLEDLELTSEKYQPNKNQTI